jgi:hypothetical protein
MRIMRKIIINIHVTNNISLLLTNKEAIMSLVTNLIKKNSEALRT